MSLPFLEISVVPAGLRSPATKFLPQNALSRDHGS